MTGTRPTVPPPPEPEAAGAPPRPAVPWTVVDLLAVAVLVLFVAMPLVTTALAALPVETGRAVAFPAQMVAFALATLGWVGARYRGHVLELFGPGRASARDALAGVAHGVAAFFGLNLVLGLLFVFLTELVGIDVAPVQQRIREFASEPAMVPFLIVSVVLAAPIAEELFFRGMLFQWLRARVPVWVAVLGSAVAFGIAHFEPGNPAGTAYMIVSLSSVGAYLAVVLQRRGTLLASIVMHATFNLLAAVWILQGFD